MVCWSPIPQVKYQVVRITQFLTRNIKHVKTMFDTVCESESESEIQWNILFDILDLTTLVNTMIQWSSWLKTTVWYCFLVKSPSLLVKSAQEFIAAAQTSAGVHCQALPGHMKGQPGAKRAGAPWGQGWGRQPWFIFTGMDFRAAWKPLGFWSDVQYWCQVLRSLKILQTNELPFQEVLKDCKPRIGDSLGCN